MRGEIGNISERLVGVVNQKNQFRKEASSLVSQESASLLTSGSSGIRHGKLDDEQQRQMNDLMSQTQKVISQRQDDNTDMKQHQWAMKSQFVGMQKWREDAESEILKDCGVWKFHRRKWLPAMFIRSHV